MDQQDSRTGFFGKLVSHGDFLSRRLSPSFVRNWEQWLQAGLHASQQRLGPGWPQAFRCSPIWHFALAAGVCGEPAWAGVMMPSVDRVGRYFPLTLAYGGPDVPVLQRLRDDGRWYAELERLALSSLQEGFALAQFDQALSRVPEPSRHASADCAPAWGQPAAGPMWLELAGQEGLEQAMRQWCDMLEDFAGQRSLAGHALFWTEGSAQLPPTLAVSQGLPSTQRFVEMLGA